MAKASRTKAINDLYNFIFSLKDKCDSINDINKDLIMQYSRFTVLASEMSRDIQDGLDKLDDKTMDSRIALYKEFNKISVGLYKTLKFDNLKDDLKDDKNPYLALMKEAADDDDL